MIQEKAFGSEALKTFQPKRVDDRITESAMWTINRFENSKDHIQALKAQKDGEALDLYSDKEAFGLFDAPQQSIIDGNLLLNEGINNLWTVACSATGTKFDTTNAYIGVGDSNTAEVATQTELQAVTNRWYQVMDATYPTYGTSQLATFLVTVAGTNANFSWNEMTLAAGANTGASPPTGTLNLCRKVSAQGAKQSGQIWVMTYSVALA